MALLYTVSPGQWVTEKLDMRWVKGKDGKKHGDYNQRKKRAFLITLFYFVACQRAPLVDKDDRRRHEEDCDIDKVGRLAYYSVVGVKE